MATVSNSEKITGVVGIAAVIVFFIGMIAATATADNFSMGSDPLSALFPETAFKAGCVIAGILVAVFGLLITVKKTESKVFIGRIRGLLIIVSGIVLIIMGPVNGNDYHWLVYLFIVLIILSAISDVFYNWVADQKVIMLLSAILTLFIAITGILSALSMTDSDPNNIMGFAFFIFVAIWIFLMAIIRFAPVAEKEPQRNKGVKAGKAGKPKESEPKKKNEPAPRPYPAKKEEPKKVAAEKPAEKEKVKKVEEPKKEEPKKVEPKVEEPKKEEPKPEEPKAKPLKVMSSREAAAAREARKKEEPAEPAPVEPVREEPTPAKAAVEPVVEPAPVVPVKESEPIHESAPPSEAETETYESTEEEEFDDFDIMEDTPDALLRRATWNKGLRCRRDYGEFQIPIAYVKAKVAVYLHQNVGTRNAVADEKLRADGWTVLHYLESDITDGKDQAEEINKAVKESLRAERAAKKKKGSKK